MRKFQPYDRFRRSLASLGSMDRHGQAWQHGSMAAWEVLWDGCDAVRACIVSKSAKKSTSFREGIDLSGCDAAIPCGAGLVVREPPVWPGNRVLRVYPWRFLGGGASKASNASGSLMEACNEGALEGERKRKGKGRKKWESGDCGTEREKVDSSDQWNVIFSIPNPYSTEKNDKSYRSYKSYTEARPSFLPFCPASCVDHSIHSSTYAVRAHEPTQPRNTHASHANHSLSSIDPLISNVAQIKNRLSFFRWPISGIILHTVDLHTDLHTYLHTYIQYM
ncbi:hypothetical protein F5Y02DRAFT_366419 [Annulohypoxylon stygium]|nr:hypothetical protein F5Y02DRAFT_366419 [Annulohypoxylon stygium]